MTQTVKNLTALLVASIGIMTACQVAAQDDRWFRVELLIFSQGAAGAENSEAWDPTPTLAYPAKRRFLIDAERVAANLSLHEALSDPLAPTDTASDTDEFGYQTITISHVTEEVEDSDPEIGAISITDPLAVPLESELELSVSDAPSDAPITPTPFTVLPRSELEFQGKAAYMQRSGRYKTLFHETWLQPMAAKTSAIPIIIDRSGDDESWPMLQGSVTFYLSRYLHLETNLWLNTAGGYLPPEWSMPPAPLGPKSLMVIQPPEEEPIYDPLLPIDDPLLAIDAQELPSAYTEEVMSEELMTEEETELEPAEPLSPWRHAVVLSQERRMRSTEVHYIDHPLLGVVVKISPVTEEELLQRAEAEAETEDDSADLTAP